MNVTPLVDVVLVLLIIFMVVAPQLEQDVPVKLPGIFNPDPDVEGARAPTMLSLTRDGEFYIESGRTTSTAALAALSDLHAVDPYRRLVLRADAGLPYGDVRDVFVRIQEVGFPGISLMVGERYQRAAERAAPGAAAAPRQD